MFFCLVYGLATRAACAGCTHSMRRLFHHSIPECSSPRSFCVLRCISRFPTSSRGCRLDGKLSAQVEHLAVRSDMYFRISHVFIGLRTKNGVVRPTELPTVGRKAPMTKKS
ncbi:hypothetical protein T484DRAFT_2282432 [Baffinella frigidus]|nr:hypothetical protein T484DRAFT_2282432 [Cryptophyta sp. CCMP2293]